MACNFPIATDRSASSLSDYAFTRLDLLCFCPKATVSSETINTLTDLFNIIHLPYSKLIQVNLYPTHFTLLYIAVTPNVSVIKFGNLQGVHVTQKLYTMKM